MHDTSTLIILNGLGFIVQIIVLAIAGTWGIARLEKSLRQAILENREEIDDQLLLIRREFGETITAIRQKVTDVEIWGRDNFVRKETFAHAADRLSDDIKSMADKIETRLLRMETKIDRNSNEKT